MIRFEQADINDPSLYTENSFDANGNSLPLLLVLGYTQGVQVIMMMITILVMIMMMFKTLVRIMFMMCLDDIQWLYTGGPATVIMMRIIIIVMIMMMRIRVMVMIMMLKLKS